jgi:hypothetical protein
LEDVLGVETDEAVDRDADEIQHQKHQVEKHHFSRLNPTLQLADSFRSTALKVFLPHAENVPEVLSETDKEYHGTHKHRGLDNEQQEKHHIESNSTGFFDIILILHLPSGFFEEGKKGDYRISRNTHRHCRRHSVKVRSNLA